MATPGRACRDLKMRCGRQDGAEREVIVVGQPGDGCAQDCDRLRLQTDDYDNAVGPALDESSASAVTMRYPWARI